MNHNNVYHSNEGKLVTYMNDSKQNTRRMSKGRMQKSRVNMNNRYMRRIHNIKQPGFDRQRRYN